VRFSKSVEKFRHDFIATFIKIVFQQRLQQKQALMLKLP